MTTQYQSKELFLLDYYCSVWVSNKICLWYTIPLEYKLIKY